MTYYEAALKILRSAKRPLTTQEITDRALEHKLITPRGKTPHATMSAVLYRRAGNDGELLKVETLGRSRAVRGTVRWTLRQT